MSAVPGVPETDTHRGDAYSDGLWRAAWKRLRHDPVGFASLIVVGAFLLLIAAASAGWVAQDWEAERGIAYAHPSIFGDEVNLEATTGGYVKPEGAPVDIRDVDPLADRLDEVERRAAQVAIEQPAPRATLPFGADRWGRDVFAKAVKGTQVSVFVGVFAALAATLIGTGLGAVAGYFGGRAGDLLEWIYNVFTAVPGILLVFAFAAVFGRGIGTVILILGLTGWTAVYRLVRAEYLKHRTREYVRAAQAIGAGHLSRMFVHILPNVGHVVLVQMSLLVVGFIKAEVILSFLGLGVPIEMVSWGTMLGEAKDELIIGKWWQLATATAFMAVFVTAFSLLTDALRDALDPRLR